MEGREGVILKLSRLLVPMCELNDESREAMVGNAQVLHLEPDASIAAEDDQPWLTYLVKGELAILGRDGVLEVVPEGSGRARRPLFSSQLRGLHAAARTSSVLVRFDRSMFRSLLSEQQRPRAGMRALTSQQLFSRVYGAWFDKTLTLPAPLPWVHALYGAGAPQTVGELTAVLRTTPELAAEFVATTNRGRETRPPASHPGEAVLQLGLASARLMALALAGRRFHAFTGNAVAVALAERQFAHSLLIGLLAFMITRNHGTIDPYRAFTAGLVHDLGALLVPAYLVEHPDLEAGEEACAIAMRRLRAVAGPALLARFGFDGGMALASEQAEHWHRNERRLNETDALIAAHLVVGQEEPTPPVPAPERVPAFGRLCPQAGPGEAVRLLRRAIRVRASLRRRLG